MITDWNRGADPGQMIFFRNVNVTPEFGKTVNWKIPSGRDFSRNYADSTSMILSEAAAKVTACPNPIGGLMKFGGKTYTVVGVVKDMLTNSPTKTIEPAIFLGDGYRDYITIRLKSGLPEPAAMASLETGYKKYNPGVPSFIDITRTSMRTNLTVETDRQSDDVRRYGHLHFLPRSVRAGVFCSRTTNQGNRRPKGTWCKYFFPLDPFLRAIYQTGIDIPLYRDSAFLLRNEQLAAELY